MPRLLRIAVVLAALALVIGVTVVVTSYAQGQRQPLAVVQVATTPTLSPTPTSVPSPTPSPTSAPTATPSPTPEPTRTPTAEPTPIATPTAIRTSTPTPRPRPTVQPSPLPSWRYTTIQSNRAKTLGIRSHYALIRAFEGEADGKASAPLLAIACKEGHLSAHISFGDNAHISSSEDSIRYSDIDVLWRIDSTGPLLDYRWRVSVDDTAVFVPRSLVLDFAKHLIKGTELLVHVTDNEGKEFFGEFAIESPARPKHPIQQVLDECPLPEEGVALLLRYGVVRAAPTQWGYRVYNDSEFVSARTVASINIGDAVIHRPADTDISTDATLGIRCSKGETGITISGRLGLGTYEKM